MPPLGSERAPNTTVASRVQRSICVEVAMVHQPGGQPRACRESELARDTPFAGRSFKHGAHIPIRQSGVATKPFYPVVNECPYPADRFARCGHIAKMSALGTVHSLRTGTRLPAAMSA